MASNDGAPNQSSARSPNREKAFDEFVAGMANSAMGDDLGGLPSNQSSGSLGANAPNSGASACSPEVGSRTNYWGGGAFGQSGLNLSSVQASFAKADPEYQGADKDGNGPPGLHAPASASLPTAPGAARPGAPPGLGLPDTLAGLNLLSIGGNHQFSGVGERSL